MSDPVTHVEVVFLFHLAVTARRGAFHPRGEVREPEWMRDLMREYY